MLFSERLNALDGEQLTEVAWCFGMLDHYPDDIAEAASLRRDIVDFVTKHPKEWLDDLTVEDLLMLRTLCQEPQVDVSSVTPLLTIESMEIVDVIESEDSMFLSLADDIRRLTAPLLDEVIAAKTERHDDLLETVFIGLLNLVGRMNNHKLVVLMKDLLSQHPDVRVSDADIDKWVQHTVLMRAMEGCTNDECVMLYSNLIDPWEWEHSVRDIEYHYPTDLVEVLGHGSYPSFSPTRQCEKALVDLLITMGGYEYDEALSDFTYFYAQNQKADGSSQLIHAIIDELVLESDKELNAAIAVITQFLNGTPRFFLNGNSSSEAMGDIGATRPVGVPAPLSDFPMPIFSMPPVGRNDPCPCGSGKKYKNCCGMLN